MSEILEKLQSVFQRVLEDDELVISRTMTAGDHASWDSINHIKLVLEVEKTFDLRLKNSDVALLESVGDLLDLIARKRTD